MTHARQAVVLLFRHDPKLVWYVYPKELKSKSKPPSVLQLSSSVLPNKYVLGGYCEKVWFSCDERWSTYIRIQVGHQCATVSRLLWKRNYSNHFPPLTANFPWPWYMMLILESRGGCMGSTLKRWTMTTVLQSSMHIQNWRTEYWNENEMQTNTLLL